MLSSSCQEGRKVVKELQTAAVEDRSFNTKEVPQQFTSYRMFKPDTLRSLRVKGFDISSAYVLGDKKILAGNYEPVDGQIVFPDSEKDWGDRLLVLDEGDEIWYKSLGAGDVYLFEPHFYRNERNGNVIILCQMAYEYYCGAEAFLWKGGKLKHMGYLDLSGKDMETSLIDIVQIKEDENRTVFSFSADSVLLSPGGDDLLVENANMVYVYAQDSLSLVKNMSF